MGLYQINLESKIPAITTLRITVYSVSPQTNCSYSTTPIDSDNSSIAHIILENQED